MPSTYNAIPAFYRLWFTVLDPLVTLFGIYTSIFDPQTILTSLVPNGVRNPAHDAVYMQLGCYSLFVFVIHAVLLCATDELKIWRIVQLATLLTDFGLLAVLHWNFESRGELSPELWRVEDWGCVGITGTVAVVRAAFLAGVGFGAAVKRE